MIVDPLFLANRSAIDHERARIEAAALNIAQANVPLAPDQAARIHRATPLDFAAMLSGAPSEPSAVLSDAGTTRKVLDPEHPLADAEGYVHFADIDLVTQMTDLMSASRSYEANVRALNLLRSTTLKAMEIGRS